jgi:hypothetical protein
MPTVIPAQAGIQTSLKFLDSGSQSGVARPEIQEFKDWTPVFNGMTV